MSGGANIALPVVAVALAIHLSPNGVFAQGQYLDRVDGLQFEGTRQLDRTEIDRRLREQDAYIPLASPVDNRSICVVKEIVYDALAEKGFTSADVTHEIRQAAGREGFVRIVFTIVEGARSRDRSVSSRVVPSASDRCAR